jgi:hypothetical protein
MGDEFDEGSTHKVANVAAGRHDVDDGEEGRQEKD